MNTACAWCNSAITNTDDPSQKICKSCCDIFTTEEPQTFADFVDSLGEPVVILDPELRVTHLNSKAQNLAQKDNKASVGHLPGEVFECAYSSLPGGCGKTIHCTGCTIRRTVEMTKKTGLAQIGVPAKVHLSANDICCHISVWKSDTAIMVLLDSVKIV